MENEKGFTLIELLTVILIIGILIAFSVPNYNNVKEHARIASQKMNMHNVAVAVETYYSEKGEYTDYFYEDDYGAYFPGGDPDADPPIGGKLPTNPWTGVDLDEDNFNPDWYDTPEAVVNTEVGGPNDDYDYEPGEMRFGTYTPLGTGRIKLWGLIGMDGKGTSIRGFDAAAEEIIIFVLHN
jgi:prepilin-type N-terminal cleavage/methylation domain-containing protein